eukprot:96807-Chlamydomonas_euryale.AAC.3
MECLRSVCVTVLRDWASQVKATICKQLLVLGDALQVGAFKGPAPCRAVSGPCGTPASRSRHPRPTPVAVAVLPGHGRADWRHWKGSVACNAHTATKDRPGTTAPHFPPPSPQPCQCAPPPNVQRDASKEAGGRVASAAVASAGPENREKESALKQSGPGKGGKELRSFRSFTSRIMSAGRRG